MYCRNCGQEIDDNADVCIHCGTAVKKEVANNHSNTIALVGFVLSFFITIAGLICSIIGLVKSKECGGKGRGFAIAGIIISVATMVISIMLYATVIDEIMGEMQNQLMIM